MSHEFEHTIAMPSSANLVMAIIYSRDKNQWDNNLFIHTAIRSRTLDQLFVKPTFWSANTQMFVVFP